MEITQLWASKRIGLGSDVKLKPGWNNVSTDGLEELTRNQKKGVESLFDEGKLRVDEDRTTGPKPPMPGDVEPDDQGPMGARELVKLIKECTTLDELDELGGANDTRVTVSEAHAEKLKELS